ncbi:MAG: alpha-1,2-fucosyltransferase [Alphaproteobacteria bacterium]|nr:alpha-1,2-fucosyltransferase [Alphaproteobacteria bacterium]
MMQNDQVAQSLTILPLNPSEQARVTAWQLRPAFSTVVQIDLAQIDLMSLRLPLFEAVILRLIIPMGVTHHAVAKLLKQIMSTPKLSPDALVFIDLVFADDPPIDRSFDPGTDFDPALFDVGFVRLSQQKIADSEANGQSWCYGRSALLPSLDWLAEKTGTNMIGFPKMGDYGRFGNQLFQWAFLVLYGLRNNCRIAADHWAGCEIYGTSAEPYHPDLRPLLSFPQIGGTESELWAMEPALANIDFLGFFQVIPPILRHHRHLLRLIFTPKPEIAKPLNDWLAQRVAPDEKLVGIHVRRGDYVAWGEKVGMFRPIPAQWFDNSLRQIWQHEAKPRLLIASDDPNIAASFADFSPLVVPPSLAPPNLEYFADFHGLTRCNLLFVANSSFSRMAALLAPDSTEFLVVNFDRAGFEPYLPWQDEVFWNRFWGNSEWEIHERGYAV